MEWPPGALTLSRLSAALRLMLPSFAPGELTGPNEASSLQACGIHRLRSKLPGRSGRSGRSVRLCDRLLSGKFPHRYGNANGNALLDPCRAAVWRLDCERVTGTVTDMKKSPPRYGAAFETSSLRLDVSW